MSRPKRNITVDSEGVRRSVRSVLRRNGVFLKLFASFLAVIAVVGLTFGVVTNRIYLSRIEREVAANAEQRFLRSASRLDAAFEALKQDVYTRTLAEIDSLVLQGGVSMYDLVQFRGTLAGLKSRNQLVSNAVYITPDFEYVVDVDGSVQADTFFKHFYQSEGFSLNFWEEETRNRWSYRVYRAGEFVIYTGPGSTDNVEYLPVAFRNARSSKYVIVVLASLSALREELGLSLYEVFHISDADRDIASLGTGSGDAGGNAYSFSRRSDTLPITYSVSVPTFYVRERLSSVTTLNSLVLAGCVALAVALSLVFSRSFNSPIKRIADLLESSGGIESQRRSGNMRYILEGVSTVIRRTQRIAEDLGTKRSVLDEVLLQAIIQSAISLDSQTINDVEEWFGGTPRFAMIAFHLHRRSTDAAEDRADRGRFLEITRELIEHYLNETGLKSLSFVASGRSVISVIRPEVRAQNIDNVISELVHRLEAENTHLHFTIVTSGICTGAGRLPEVHDELSEMYDHRALVDTTQVLRADDIHDPVRAVSFSEDTRARIRNLLTAGNVAESADLASSVIEENLVAGVRSLGISRLSSEILGACETAILQVQPALIAEFPIESFQRRIELCDTGAGFAALCAEMARTCAGLLRDVERDADRIVSYTRARLHEGYAGIISFEEIADELRITRTYLSTYFKQKTGTSLSEYLTSLRVQKASELLRNTGMMIKNVGDEVGIPNITTFSRVFRRMTGQTPKEFRRTAALRGIADSDRKR